MFFCFTDSVNTRGHAAQIIYQIAIYPFVKFTILALVYPEKLT